MINYLASDVKVASLPKFTVKPQRAQSGFIDSFQGRKVKGWHKKANTLRAQRGG
jgi:hypothetical protein